MRYSSTIWYVLTGVFFTNLRFVKIKVVLTEGIIDHKSFCLYQKRKGEIEFGTRNWIESKSI